MEDKQRLLDGAEQASRLEPLAESCKQQEQQIFEPNAAPALSEYSLYCHSELPAPAPDSIFSAG